MKLTCQRLNLRSHFLFSFFQNGLLQSRTLGSLSFLTTFHQWCWEVQHVIWSKGGNLLVSDAVIILTIIVSLLCLWYPLVHIRSAWNIHKYTTPVIRYHKTWAGNFLSQPPFIKYVHAWSTSFTACPGILYFLLSLPPSHTCTHTRDTLRSRGTNNLQTWLGGPYDGRTIAGTLQLSIMFHQTYMKYMVALLFVWMGH